MKKIVLVFVFLATLFCFSQDEAFQRGNALYNQEKYQEAIDSYMSILDQGKESVSLYYNLGNAHYKLNNVGPSIFYFEKALELKPNDEDVKNNLGFAQKATIDAIDEIPEGFVSRIMNNFTNMFSFDRWAWISVLCVLLFVVLFITYYSAQASSKKRFFFVISMVLLLFGLFSILFAFKQYNFVVNNQYAIVFAKETEIKSAPNLRSEEVFMLHEGTKVKVTETVNDWKKIKLADGKIGWIPASDIKEL
ncbi:tetratricopeptide repeat protein [Aquimarina algicola]|uniref:Tetratricopeptide repeat protein n=1 Tax=Aquimarina algicola TaxID=2589995 RepID=A0A504J812_9FLAO|nr:tetratricopeptide repeat protein [Aquimarina algicola]TPN84058.1 tetratricopeptide repeat protein [Aquimarina algicola]